MTDFQIFEDKSQVLLSLIILKMEEKMGRKEMELCMSVMNEASYIERRFFFFYPLPTTGLPLYNNYEKQSSNKFRIGNWLDLDKDGDRRSHTTSIFP